MKKFAVEFKWAVRYIFAYLAWIMGEKVLGVYDTHIDWFLLSSLGFYLFGFVLYVLALREKRDTVFQKQMDWKQGCVSGFYLTIFISLLMVLAQVVVHKAIAPEFFPNMIRYNLENGNKKAGEIFNLQSYLYQAVFFTLSIGVLYAAAVAYFLRTRPKN